MLNVQQFMTLKSCLLSSKTVNTYCLYTKNSMAPKKKLSGKILCEKKELDLELTLKSGQSFRWTEIENEKKYRGVFTGEAWTLHQDDQYLYFTAHSSKLKNIVACENELIKYFNLKLSLKENLENWSDCDPNFKKFSTTVNGVRVLNQDVIENTFSFICSANNNIARITTMVEKMCRFFGEKICLVDNQWYYDFPKIQDLAADEVREILAKEGFGYRGPYIHNTAKKLIELGGRKWLESLHKDQGAEYEEAKKTIQVLPGVGPKVADCICLMSLGHLEAIPVDTHIYQVARETYLPDLKEVSSVTPAIYQDVSRHLRTTWGPLAGWAQTVVFCTRINSNARRKKSKSSAAEKPQKKLRNNIC